MRIYLEQINGIYQGVIFPFREGFSSGVFRMTWGNDGTMFVGMTSRGWSSTGKKPYGLQQVVWTGNIPFEMKTIKIKKDGFEINFTKPIDPKSALDKNSYDITRFNYKYHADYGSPVIDNTSCPIRDVEIRTDSLSVRLYVDSLKLGDIHEIKAEGIKSSKGIKLLHDVGYYTLNSFPNKDIPLNKDDRGGKSNSQNSGSHLISDTDRTTFHAPEDYNDSTKKEFLQNNGLSYEKRVTKMPKEWKGQIDRSIRIGTKPGMKFDKEYVTIKAGSKIELTFVNTDDMLHNLLIVNPKSAIEVGESALKLGLKGHQKQYIPDNKNVLYHTNILQPNNSETIYFIAPNTPGEYMYVCTIPGHYLSMQGVMKVE